MFSIPENEYELKTNECMHACECGQFRTSNGMKQWKNTTIKSKTKVKAMGYSQN